MSTCPIQVAAEDAIRALQAALPPGLTKPLTPVELENVKPTLLLPPTEKGGVASELAGGAFDLGDRVACLKSTGQQASLQNTLCQQGWGCCTSEGPGTSVLDL